MSLVELTGESRLLVLKSKDRITEAGSSSTNFKVNIGTDVNLSQIRRVVLKSAHFINGAYNVNSSNNSFVYTHSVAGLNTAVVAEGQYTTSSLSAALKAVIDLQITTDTIAITQDPITLKLTFTITGAGTITLYEENDPTNPNPMAPLVGILTTTAVPAAAVVADRPPDLTGLSRAFIHSDKLSPFNNFDSQQDVGDIFINIPVTSAFGVSNHAEAADDELVSINHIPPRDMRGLMDIRLEDIDGNNINLNGYETDFVFKVYF
jgi:hypothetical protein